MLHRLSETEETYRGFETVDYRMRQLPPVQLDESGRNDLSFDHVHNHSRHDDLSHDVYTIYHRLSGHDLYED